MQWTPITIDLGGGNFPSVNECIGEECRLLRTARDCQRRTSLRTPATTCWWRVGSSECRSSKINKKSFLVLHSVLHSIRKTVFLPPYRTRWCRRESRAGPWRWPSRDARRRVASGPSSWWPAPWTSWTTRSSSWSRRWGGQCRMPSGFSCICNRVWWEKIMN